MERISAVTVHGGPQFRSPARVQCLEVFEKAGGEFADLAARKADAVPLRQFATDLLPLAVAEETIEADMNLQVVAMDLARRYFEHQCFGSSRHQLSRRVPAAGLAHVNGLVGDEIPVFQRDDPMLDRFLDLGRSTAPATTPFRRLRLGPDTSGAEDPMPPILLEAAQLHSHRRDRREAAFFLPSS